MASWEQGHNTSYEVVGESDVNPRYPNGIVVALLMVVGLAGNSLVLYVYHFKMEHTVFTTFVTFLAGLDLATTLTGMPLDVVIKSLRMDKTEAMDAICKVAHFEVYTSSLASGSILLLIAATRYSKVCQPTQPAWTVRQARVWCLLIVLVAMVLCLVSLVINGLEKVRISVGVDERFSPGNLPHDLYLPTNESVPNLQELFRSGEDSDDDDARDAFDERHFFRHNDSHYATKTKVVEVYICRTSEEQRGTMLYYILYGLLMTAYVTICLALLVLHSRISCTLVRFKRRQFRRGSVWSDQDQHNLNHITTNMFRIFVAITVIFVLSYLPHLVCVIVQRTVFRTGEAMPRTTRVFLDLAYNFPYVNVVANPFIYGYMSKRFRSHCSRVLCSCWD